MKKEKICKKCNNNFIINFKINDKNICLSNRSFCLLCKPKRQKISKDAIENIIKEYNLIGAEECQKKFKISKNQITYIASKYKLKLNPKTHSKIKSKSKIEIDPFKYKVNHLSFSNINNSICAYILGLIWTDGHINSRNNSIIFSTTYPDSEYFSKEFLKTGSWNIYRYKSNKNHKDKISIITTNKFLKETLVSLGFLEKIKGLEKVYEHIPENLKHYFIRGLIDGDGCFYVNKKKSIYRFSLCSCLNQNWNCIQKLLDSLSIKYKIENSTTKNGSYSKIHISGIPNVKKFGDFVYRNRQDDFIGLDRKYKKYLEVQFKT